MPSRSSFAPTTIARLAILSLLVLACGAAAPSAVSPNVGAPLGSPGASVGPSPSVAGRDAPPDAVLATEGGDPVAGQLGTYLWLETGSESPWLPGAPLKVGGGEPLAMRLVPDGDIGGWRARYVPAGAPGPEGTIVLGEGSGNPSFDAPGPGTWTVEVYVEFAAGVGDASYFWRLEVE